MEKYISLNTEKRMNAANDLDYAAIHEIKRVLVLNQFMMDSLF